MRQMTTHSLIKKLKAMGLKADGVHVNVVLEAWIDGKRNLDLPLGEIGQAIAPNLVLIESATGMSLAQFLKD